MKLYLISNPKRFSGSIQTLYKEGQLQKIDFSSADIAAPVLEKFLTCIAPSEEQLVTKFGSDTLVIEGEFEVSFDDFSREYPYKRNTHLSRAYWPKMSKAQQVQAYEAAKAYRKYLEREIWQKPMISDKWLKTELYLNDWTKL